MIEVTEILKVVMSVCAVLVAFVLIPFLKSKLSKEQLHKMIEWGKIACSAAEEAARCGLISKEEKPSYALDVMRKHGFTFDENEAQTFLCSICWELFNRFRNEVESVKISDPALNTEEMDQEEIAE